VEQVCHEAGAEGFAGFYLDGGDAVFFFHDAVNLYPRIVPPEIKVGPQPPVKPAFEEFRKNKRLKNRGLRRMEKKLLFGFDVEDAAEEARIDKIKFWLLDQSLPEIPVMGLKKKNNPAGL
jgi:hypothetical protein